MTKPGRPKWQAHPGAVQDLQRLAEDDPRLSTRAIALIDLLASNDVRGIQLAAMSFYGDLAECYKYYFGLNDTTTHRIVYRQLSNGTIEVIEVIAVEQRQDGYVYLLAASRLGRLPESTKKAFERIHQQVIARRGTKRRTNREPRR